MTIEQKLEYIHRWTKPEALKCWTRFHELYESKHAGGFHYACMTGTTKEYIQKECDTFKRYARQWAYYRGRK